MSNDLTNDQVGGYAPLNLDELSGISGTSNNEYETDQVLGDMIKVKLVDENETGEILRDGIWLKPDVMSKTWRVGEVVKRGSQVPPELQIGTLVRFPSDRGIPQVSLGIKYAYLNASRIFETVKKVVKI